MPLTRILPDGDLLAQSFDPSVLDGPEPDDYVGLSRESFCLACQAPVARFENRGGDLAHYAGDPTSDSITPYKSDHAPFLP